MMSLYRIMSRTLLLLLVLGLSATPTMTSDALTASRSGGEMATSISDHPPLPWYEFPLEDE